MTFLLTQGGTVSYNEDTTQFQNLQSIQHRNTKTASIWYEKKEDGFLRSRTSIQYESPHPPPPPKNKKTNKKIIRWQQQQQEFKVKLELRKLEIQWKLCFWLLIKARRFAYFCWWTCLLGPRNKLQNTKPVLSLNSIDTELSIAYKITT